MNTLSKEAEARILDAIQDVCEHVTGGMEPTSAVIKVAEEEGLTPNFVKLVCTGYNTGATTYQREKASHILDKMAEFPIADLDSVMSHLYPDKPKSKSLLKESSAVSDEYKSAPRAGRNNPLTRSFREKIAAAPCVPGAAGTSDQKDRGRSKSASGERMKHAYNQSLDLKRALETKRAEYANSQDKLLQGLADLLETVKRGSYDLPSLEYAAKARHGEAGARVFSYLYANEPRLKRAFDARKLVEADWDGPVLSRVERICKAASDVVRLRVEYDDLCGNTADKVAGLLDPFELAPTVSTTQKTNILSGSNSLQQKSAAGFLGGMIGGAAYGLGNTAARSLGGASSLAKTPGDLAGGMAEDLDDPEHEGQLRQIQARTMLQDLMMNDEVISGYDPGEILDAYNEIVGVTPRSATQAAIVRPLLRKRLTQGAIEPFEAAEMVNIEKNLGEVNKAPSPMAAVHKEGSTNVLQHRILG
jgi:hypothetical protein